MKFDMSEAWNEAMRLVAANRQVLVGVAGVFFFLPYLAFMLMTGGQTAELEAAAASQTDPAALMGAMMEFYGSIWWMLVLLSIFQSIGLLSLLVLLTDRARPTVGDALKIGATHFPTYLVAQILFSVLAGIVATLPVLVGMAISPLVGVLLGFVALAAVAYLFVKFLLVPAVVAIERVLNPIAAMARSWRLTKGNSLRVFGFFVLLIVAIAIVIGIASLVTGLILALFGPTVMLIGQGIVSSLFNAVWVTLFMAVLAATHRQLSGTSTASLNDTFE